MRAALQPVKEGSIVNLIGVPIEISNEPTLASFHVNDSDLVKVVDTAGAKLTLVARVY